VAGNTIGSPEAVAMARKQRRNETLHAKTKLQESWLTLIDSSLLLAEKRQYVYFVALRESGKARAEPETGHLKLACRTRSRMPSCF